MRAGTGKHRGGLGKQVVSRSREKSAPDPATSLPPNPTNRSKRKGENAGGKPHERVRDEPHLLRGETRGDGECRAQRSACEQAADNEWSKSHVTLVAGRARKAGKLAAAVA